jgi:IS1 family transposase
LFDACHCRLNASTVCSCSMTHVMSRVLGLRNAAHGAFAPRGVSHVASDKYHRMIEALGGKVNWHWVAVGGALSGVTVFVTGRRLDSFETKLLAGMDTMKVALTTDMAKQLEGVKVDMAKASMEMTKQLEEVSRGLSKLTEIVNKR